MHADARADWSRIAIITSEFQMARTRAIYEWVFALAPLPAGKPRYALSYLAVDDAGALPEAALQASCAETLRTPPPLSLHPSIDSSG